MEVLMRFFILFILTLFAAEAEDSLLQNTHIRMIPKIMALDTRLSAKTASPKAVLAIVYDSNRMAYAENIADTINVLYNNKVTNIAFSAIAFSVDELLGRRDIAFVYLPQSGKTQSVKKIAAWGIANSIPTFSYDVNDLENGILGSIAIERSTIVYINKNTLKEGKFRFNDILFQIARLVE
jgi:hypothetical protein